MTISATTKIGTVIKFNPRAIEALMSLSPHFNRLKNPLLRRLFAPRVTIAEAASIGDCSVEVILDSLVLIGFEVNHSPGITEKEIETADDVRIDPVISHDARPELDAGLDPLSSILKKLSAVKAGQTMLVINSFEPVPLIRVLKSKGYMIAVSRRQSGMVYTYVTRADEPGPLTEPGTAMPEDEELFENILRHYHLKFTELDVRQMEMPTPMITILDELEHLQDGEALYVRHRKIPVHLLPELRERNFNYVFKQMASDVIILIYPAHSYN